MIKKVYLQAAIFIFAGNAALAQVGTSRKIGRASEIAKSISNSSIAVGAVYTLPTPSGNSIKSVINLKSNEDGKVVIAGSAGLGSFNLEGDATGNVSGNYVCFFDRKAYTYSTDASGNLVTEEVAIESLVCIDFPQAQATPYDEAQAAKATPQRRAPIPKFSSKPNSPFVMYIDLDGEYTQNSFWNNGNPIDAVAQKNFSDAEVKEIWQVTAQDYLPFDVNITTDRAKFDAAPKSKRKMCVVTSTNKIQAGAGGFAKVSSFGKSDEVCWVWNAVSSKVIGETVSHEFGHTVGLEHDGPGYYQGHNNWAPIMGAVYSTADKKIDSENVIGQWSKGEYSGASQKQDDLSSIISFGFGFEPDDYGNTNNASNIGKLAIESDGKVLNEKNSGIIEKNTDVDVFEFKIGAGDMEIIAEPYLNADYMKYPNLNIQLRLLSSTGTELAKESPSVTMNTYAAMAATIKKTGLAAGTYYLEIDGVGNGTASDGYTGYASLGGYSIKGVLPKATGLNDEKTKIAQFNIFPNPSNGAFNVTFNTAHKSDYKLSVINALGQTVYEELLSGFSGAYSKQLNLGEYGKGVFVINISDNESTAAKRAVVY
jgi:hypothetical protein